MKTQSLHQAVVEFMIELSAEKKVLWKVNRKEELVKERTIREKKLIKK